MSRTLYEFIETVCPELLADASVETLKGLEATKLLVAGAECVYIGYQDGFITVDNEEVESDTLETLYPLSENEAERL